MIAVFGGRNGCALPSDCSTLRIVVGYILLFSVYISFIVYVVIIRRDALSDGFFAVFVSFANQALVVFAEGELAVESGDILDEHTSSSTISRFVQSTLATVSGVLAPVANIATFCISNDKATGEFDKLLFSLYIPLSAFAIWAIVVALLVAYRFLLGKKRNSERYANNNINDDNEIVSEPLLESAELSGDNSASERKVSVSTTYRAFAGLVRFKFDFFFLKGKRLTNIYVVERC